MPGRLSSGISRLTYGPTWVTGAASGQISDWLSSLGSHSSSSSSSNSSNSLRSQRSFPSSDRVEGKVRSHDAGANYTQLYMCVCVLVCAVANCTHVRGGGNSQLATGNWQHSNPISHACNHHDHYERKCRKSRRFLTATERPPSDRATNRPTE